MKRMYEEQPAPAPFGGIIVAPVQPYPAARLEEVIDDFLLQGVVPDVVKAEIGHDDDDEIDPVSGWPSVDPKGRLDVDPIDILEQRYCEARDRGIVDITASPEVQSALPSARSHADDGVVVPAESAAPAEPAAPLTE